jgi:phosphate transport system substrate-binding protein
MSVLVVACLLGAQALAFAGTITVKGSTTVQPVMQKAAEAFMKANPGVSISISASGSGDGAKAIIDKTCDLAMMSRDMKDSETKAATEKGGAPKQWVIAYDCIVPVVHPSNKVENLTIAQLKDIYTGKITDWKDLGGEAGKIVVISRDSSSGTFEFWNEHVLNKERVFPGALLQASNGAVSQAVSKNKYAIGYVSLAYAQNKELKSLKVAGVAGSAATVLDKSYQVSRGLNLYTNGEPKGELADLMKFIMSPEGQKLVQEADYVPLKK